VNAVFFFYPLIWIEKVASKTRIFIFKTTLSITFGCLFVHSWLTFSPVLWTKKRVATNARMNSRRKGLFVVLIFFLIVHSWLIFSSVLWTKKRVATNARMNSRRKGLFVVLILFIYFFRAFVANFFIRNTDKKKGCHECTNEQPKERVVCGLNFIYLFFSCIRG